MSTHGGYPDHGCPYDYYRWTADGLARNLQSLGFEICRLEKQTTGPRSLFFQCDCHYQSLSAPRRSIFGMALHAFKLIYARIQPWLHRMCDRYFSDHRVVTKQLDNHNTYIVTACLARKI
jgi:hypothetical protein